MASRILHLPDYCKLFKNFLVEELVFYETPFDFHYGKCSVIGTLCERNNSWYLKNITLSCVDKEYQLRTGGVEILLLPTSYRSNPGDVSSFRNLANGSFYEVHGETAFCNVNDANSAPFTTAELIIKLRMENLIFYEVIDSYELQDIPTSACIIPELAVKKHIKNFTITHVPCIQVHTINQIDKAEELIQCNLELRLIRQQRRQNNF